MTDNTTPAAQSATVDDTALRTQIKDVFRRESLTPDSAYVEADVGVLLHELMAVVTPVLAAKDAQIERLRAELADITKTAWEDRESRIKEADQLRADLAERTRERDERFRSVVHQCCEDVQTLRAELERERNPNVALSLANQSAFSASLAAVQARYADGFKLQRDAARAELAAKDERIGVLQRSWDRARDANTAWLDGRVVVLPEAWQGAVTNAVYFNYGPEPKLIDQLCELIESWRPATEPAEAGEPEFLDNASAHVPGYRNPAAPAAPEGTEPRQWYSGDPEPPGVRQVKDRGDRRWVYSRTDRNWYMRDIVGPVHIWDYLVDLNGPLTEVPTEGGKA